MSTKVKTFFENFSLIFQKKETHLQLEGTTRQGSTKKRQHKKTP